MQGLLRDDEPDGAIAGQQTAGFIHFLQFIPLARLDGDMLRPDAGMPQQIFPGVLRMDQPRTPLVLACALHLDQADGTNVLTGPRLMLPRRLFKPLAVFNRLQQSILPVRARAVPDVQIQFDHPLCVQLMAPDIDKHIGSWGRRR